MGFEPMTFRTPCGCSTNWAARTLKGAGPVTGFCRWYMDCDLLSAGSASPKYIKYCSDCCMWVVYVPVFGRSCVQTPLENRVFSEFIYICFNYSFEQKQPTYSTLRQGSRTLKDPQQWLMQIYSCYCYENDSSRLEFPRLNEDRFWNARFLRNRILNSTRSIAQRKIKI